MVWIALALTAFIALSALTTVATVGKERKPTTPGVAVAVVIIDALIIVGVLALGGVL